MTPTSDETMREHIHAPAWDEHVHQPAWNEPSRDAEGRGGGGYGGGRVMIAVQAINLGRRIALLNDGSTVPVTNLLDADGDETEAPAEAVGFVAGEGRTWFAGRVADYEGVNSQ